MPPVPFSFVTDLAYYRQGRLRFRSTRKSRWVRIAVNTVLGVALAFPAYITAWKLHSWISLVFVPFYLLLFFGEKLDWLGVSIRLKKSPFFNRQVHGELTDEHFAGGDDRSHGTLAWSVFTKALVLPDGILLFQGANLYNWLPNSGFAHAADFERARDLVRQKVKDTRIV